MECGGEGISTVRRPSEIDPTNFNVETVLNAMTTSWNVQSSYRGPNDPSKE